MYSISDSVKKPLVENRTLWYLLVLEIYYWLACDHWSSMIYGFDKQLVSILNLSTRLCHTRLEYDTSHYKKKTPLPVFHLAISNMAQRHVAFWERHIALHERHVALHKRHVALRVRHVAFLIFRRWSASLNYCYVIIDPPRSMWQSKTPQSLMSRVHTYHAIPDNWLCVHSCNNWRCLHT